jgi:hypothetical protein
LADASLSEVDPPTSVVAEQCARCHGIFPIGALFRNDPEETDLFAELLWDEILDRHPDYKGRVKTQFRHALAVRTDGVVISAGSSFPLWPPRKPAIRRVYFAQDINVGMGGTGYPTQEMVRAADQERGWKGVFTTAGAGRCFGPRAVVRLSRLNDMYRG